MRATLEIKMDNAAFTNSEELHDKEAQETAAYYELAHILEELSTKARFCNDSIRAIDSNGNTVGYLTVDKKNDHEDTYMKWEDHSKIVFTKMEE